MFVRSRSRSPSRRCTYCHGDLVGGALCVECHAALHDECRIELGRCPSLGCRSATFERLGGEPVETVSRPSRFEIESLILKVRIEAVGVAILLVFLFALIAGVASAEANSFTRRKNGTLSPPNPTCAVLWIVAGFGASIGTVVIQSLYARNVRRLLRDTYPRVGRLRVEPYEQRQKGGSILLFRGHVTEHGRKTLELELGQKPDWLGPFVTEGPISIYGGGPFEPVILCDKERLRVVRHYRITRI